MRKLSVYSKSIICLAAVAAVSTVGYVLSAHKNAQDNLELAMEYGSVNLFSFDANLIRTVEIETENDEIYRLHYENSDWSIDDVNFSPNEAMIESTVSVMSALTSVRTISFDAQSEDLAMYGLDNPVSVNCVLSDMSEHKIYIGNATPTGENYYAMREGENYIYLIGAEDGYYLDCSKNALKDPYIIKYGTIYSDVTYIKIERDNELVFEGEYGGTWTEYPMQSYFSNSLADRWVAKAPIDWNVDYSNVSTIVDNIIRVTVYDFVEENCQNLEQYGLDEPKYRFSLKTEDGEEINLIFGNTNIDGTYIYAMYEDTRQVVLFATGDVAFLDVTLEEIYNPMIYVGHTLITNYNQTDIAEIDLYLDGESHHITNNSYDDINEYTFDGHDLYGDINGTALLEELYTAMASLTCSSIDNSDEDVQKGDSPYLSIHYTCADGDEVSIELYQTPDDEMCYYAFLNGEYTRLLVRENVIDSANGIRVTCNALIKHIEDNR